MSVYKLLRFRALPDRYNKSTRWLRDEILVSQC